MKPVAWAVLFLALSLTGAFGQCGDPITIQNPSIETAGGITYLKFSYDFICPQLLVKRAAVIQGTNVDQSVFLGNDVFAICTDEFPPTIYTRQASLVIGQLSPGDYFLRVYTSGGPFGGVVPIFQGPFTVVETSRTISLQPAAAGEVVFRVDGTSNATYHVQSSLTLTNWTTIYTATRAPFVITNQPSTNTFYRVQVSDGIPLCP